MEQSHQFLNLIDIFSNVICTQLLQAIPRGFVTDAALKRMAHVQVNDILEILIAVMSFVLSLYVLLCN